MCDEEPQAGRGHGGARGAGPRRGQYEGSGLPGKLQARQAQQLRQEHQQSGLTGGVGLSSDNTCEVQGQMWDLTLETLGIQQFGPASQ